MGDQRPTESVFMGLSEDFSNRLASAREEKADSRSKKLESWGVSAGQYEGNFFVDQQEASWNIKRGPFDLASEETVYYDLIRQKLQDRQKAQDTTPVIVADVGGMYGTTWCRLALHLKDEVQQGKVRFLVTNLNLGKENIVDAFNAEMEADPYDDRMQKSFLAGKDLIEWKKMDVAELWEQFQGQIDIAHESRSLKHSVIPDVDFPMVGQTLRKDGIFISRSGVPHPAMFGYKETHETEVEHAFDQSKRTMDTKYHRLLAGKTDADVWSPDASAGRYFHDSKTYPSVIKYAGELPIGTASPRNDLLKRAKF